MIHLIDFFNKEKLESVYILLALDSEKEHLYFNNNEYITYNLQILIKAINHLPYFLQRKYFYKKKNFLG